jgi:hypothetical protein
LTGGYVDKALKKNSFSIFKCGGRTLNIFNGQGTVRLASNSTLWLHGCNSSFFSNYTTIRSIATGADVLGTVFGSAVEAEFIVEDSIIFWWPQVR